MVEKRSRMKMELVFANRWWIDFIYEELTQNRCLQICVFYCLCVVYLYTNSTISFCRSCRANCHFVVRILTRCKLF